MLKNSLLVGIALLSIFSMKSIFFSDNLKENGSKEIIYDTDSVKVVQDSSDDIYDIDMEIENGDSTQQPKSKKTDKRCKKDNNIQQLFREAEVLTTGKHYYKALDKYDEIIKELKDSDKIELQKNFAEALFLKAFIFTTYLKDKDKAIRNYDIIVERFKDSSDIELQKSYFNAQKLKALLVDKYEALDIYDAIINKFRNSDSIELLKKFSFAQNAKIALLDDNEDEIIEIYDDMIEKFKDTKNEKLLSELLNAQLSKAYVLSGDTQNYIEIMEIYDEVIDKFDSYSKFKQEVADVLFSKSYLMMQEDKEKSMEILDDIINRYENSKDRDKSKDFEYAVINNIELALVTNNDDQRYRDLANRYLLDIKDTKPQLEMLDILRNAQDINQDEAMAKWKDKYKNYQFENWSFDTLKEWNSQMEDSQEKARIENYLNEFIKHS